MCLFIDCLNNMIIDCFSSFAEFDNMMNRILTSIDMNVDALRVETVSWSEQFRNAMNVNGGDIEGASSLDYFMHFLTFGWKVCHNMLLYTQYFCFLTLMFIIFADSFCFHPSDQHLERVAILFCFSYSHWSSNCHCGRFSSHLWVPGRIEGRCNCHHICGLGNFSARLVCK